LLLLTQQLGLFLLLLLKFKLSLMVLVLFDSLQTTLFVQGLGAQLFLSDQLLLEKFFLMLLLDPFFNLLNGQVFLFGNLLKFGTILLFFFFLLLSFFFLFLGFKLGKEITCLATSLVIADLKILEKLSHFYVL